MTTEKVDKEVQYIYDTLTEKHFTADQIETWRTPGKLHFKVNIEGTWHEYTRVSH